MYYTVKDVMEILGVGRTKGYNIIHTLNNELRLKGFLTQPGKVSAKYFSERYYSQIREKE